MRRTVSTLGAADAARVSRSLRESRHAVTSSGASMRTQTAFRIWPPHPRVLFCVSMVVSASVCAEEGIRRDCSKPDWQENDRPISPCGRAPAHRWREGVRVIDETLREQLAAVCPTVPRTRSGRSATCCACSWRTGRQDLEWALTDSDGKVFAYVTLAAEWHAGA